MIIVATIISMKGFYMKTKNNLNPLLMAMITLCSYYHLTITNDISNNVITSVVVDEQALLVMIEDNDDRINRVLELCANEDENMEVFMEKAHSLIKEHMQWQQNNISLLVNNFRLAQKIDVLWIAALQELEQSIQDETNSLVKEKKITAINIISEGLNGNLYKFLQS